jgi:erythronate-4-phosphate dehydrogenase
MRIVADAAIPLVEEAFRSLGNVALIPSSGINTESINGADILLVRSENRVDRALLDGTSVRFVGTATAGIDHVDTDYLHQEGIDFCSAPGCNANAVKEYWTAAVLLLAKRYGLSLKGMTLGVVGVGNVGSLVARAGLALGMEVILNDPPLADQTGESRFVELDPVLETDFLTLHVPLTLDGPYPTCQLMTRQRLDRMKPTAFLLNTARGAVMDQVALGQSLKARKLAGAVLDVWQDEPKVDYSLMPLLELATFHIAGYSRDGKLKGTRAIYEGACQFLGEQPVWSSLVSARLGAVVGQIDLSNSVTDLQELRRQAVEAAYDIALDDAALREGYSMTKAEQSRHFLRLRTGYRFRHEFGHTRVKVSSDEAGTCLEELGFAVSLAPD